MCALATMRFQKRSALAMSMAAVSFWLSAVMAGAGFGTSNLFGTLFEWSGVLLLLLTFFFEVVDGA
jgi:hypothetical protein